jgi:hypothetical protein
VSQEGARKLVERATADDKLISLTTEALADTGSPEPGFPSNVVEIFKQGGKPQPAPIAPAHGTLGTLAGPGSSSAAKNPLKGFEEK